MRTVNARLQARVLDELRWDPDIDASAIGVAVADGVVTLLGEVPSFDMKDAAAAAAARVHGVRAVAQRLAVHCPGSLSRTDTDLAHDVADVLRAADCGPSIKALVEDGELHLEGFADWESQRDAAESVVEAAHARLRGLKRVVNDIVVSQPATLPGVLSARRAV